MSEFNISKNKRVSRLRCGWSCGMSDVFPGEKPSKEDRDVCSPLRRIADPQAEALEGLKAKRTGTSPFPALDLTPTSPDSVLVPASSSPVAPPRSSTSKFFNPASSAGRSNPFPSSTAIPSSRLGNGGVAAPNGNSGGLGTPASIVSAINRRHEDAPSSTTAVPTSPSSPAPLSRLKNKYEDTPVKNGLTATSSSPLVQAARKQNGVNAEEMAARVAVQFPRFSHDEIVAVIKRFPNDPDQAINQLTFMANHGASSSSAPGSSRPGSMASLGQTSSVDAVEHVELLPRAKKLGKVGGGKNINSSIYANRNKQDDSPSSMPSAPVHGSKLAKSKTKRRDPDESESEAEAKAGGSDESDMEWSGDEGRRKRKRRDDDDDEVDAQGAALKAFNEVDAEVLTGTIGESPSSA